MKSIEVHNGNIQIQFTKYALNWFWLQFLDLNLKEFRNFLINKMWLNVLITGESLLT